MTSNKNQNEFARKIINLYAEENDDNITIFNQYIINSANLDNDTNDIKLLKTFNILASNIDEQTLQDNNNEKISGYYFHKKDSKKHSVQLLGSLFYDSSSFSANRQDQLLKYYSPQNFIYSFVLFDILNTSINKDKNQEHFFKLADSLGKLKGADFTNVLKLLVKIQLGSNYSKYRKDYKHQVGRIVNGKKVFNSSYIHWLTDSKKQFNFSNLNKKLYEQFYKDVTGNKVKENDTINDLKDEIRTQIIETIKKLIFGNYGQIDQSPAKRKQKQAKDILRIIDLLINYKLSKQSNLDWQLRLISSVGIDAEHILPFKNNEKDNMGFIDREDYLNGVYRLGNFTLFESEYNQANKNISFEVKNEMQSKIHPQEKDIITNYNNYCEENNEPNEEISCIHTYDESESIMTKTLSHLDFPSDDFNVDDAKYLKQYEHSYYKVANHGTLNKFRKEEIENRTDELAKLIADYVVNDQFRHLETKQ